MKKGNKKTEKEKKIISIIKGYKLEELYVIKDAFKKTMV